MTTKEKIFLESKAWAKEKLDLDKDYFARLDGMHTPYILWIGSSDTLIPVSEVTNTDPGEILVYRNIASQIREDDISMMAIIEDAVEIEHIEYIVVCGYSHCSGVRDVLLGTDDRPFVKYWLKDLRKLYEENVDELDLLDFEQKERRLCELNVKAQIKNLSKLDCIQKAWIKNDFPVLYGWYFDLHTGSLKEIFSMEDNHRLKQNVLPS